MPVTVLWIAVLLLALPVMALAQTPPFGITLPPSLNFATSPNPVGSGARAVGKGTAFIGVADDATAASHNPGGLVQLERPEMSIVGSYGLTLERPDVTRSDVVLDDQNLQAFRLNYLSVVYPFQLLRRNAVVSLNMQRLYDLKGATDTASRFATLEGIQRVRSRQQGGLFSISPAVAVQVTPTFSLGAALNIWPDALGNGWSQDVTVGGAGRLVSGNRVVPFVSQGRIQEDYGFQGLNVTAGFLWALHPRVSLGGVLRTPFRAKVFHTHTSSLSVTLQDGSAPVTSGPVHFRETLDMDFPLAYGLGLAARLSDALTLALDVSRVHWSDFRLYTSSRSNVLLVENGAPSGKGEAVLRGQADDTTSVRLGAEYLWIMSKLVVPFRAGVFYDPEPGTGSPDTFFGFSLGSGLAIDKVVFDLAYTFRTGTAENTVSDTAITQHGILASIIYHF
ncbi:MAG: OmpP1/FadL family transporter [Candidatus Tectimicrobiota bacterium]